MTGAELIKQLKANHVTVTLADGNLRCRAREGVLTSDLTEMIRAHKPRLLEYLSLPGQKIYRDVEQDARLSEVFELAEAAGYPELSLSKFETVPAGAAVWRLFLAYAKPEQLQAAANALEGLIQHTNGTQRQIQGFSEGQTACATDK